MLDSATGCAIHTMLDAGVAYATIDLNVKMLKPIPIDQPMTAEARVIHMSTNIGAAEGSIRDGDGVLFAHATATCVILPRRDPR